MTLSLNWLTTLFFINIRLSTVILISPIQAFRQLPVQTRLLLLCILSLLLVNYLPNIPQESNFNLILSAITEFANGLILSMSLYAAFSVFQIAGQLIENASGLNVFAVFDPNEHSQQALTSHLLTLLAVLYFFGLDGPIWMFKGLAYSLIIVPPGSMQLFSGFVPILKQFGFAFSMGLVLATPIMFSLFIVDICGAFITRNMPQVSSYFLTLPVKIILGLLLLYLTLNYLNPITNNTFERCFSVWQELMS